MKIHYYKDKTTLFASPRAGEAGERSEPGEGFFNTPLLTLQANSSTPHPLLVLRTISDLSRTGRGKEADCGKTKLYPLSCWHWTYVRRLHVHLWKYLMRIAITLSLVAFLAPFASAQKNIGFDKAVKKFDVTFEPAQAKPGETVTLKITLDLNEGYYTYPTVQPEKSAANMVNKIVFPAPGALIFVGETTDPKNAKSKAEPLMGIDEMRYYTGTVVFERHAVVSPNAKPGATTVTLPNVLLSVCDKDNCFPAKKLMPEAVFKVLDGPAVPVQKAYATEVNKLLNK